MMWLIMSSDIQTPYNDRFKIVQNELLSDVCGQVDANHIQIDTNNDRYVGNICARFETDYIINRDLQ